MGQPQYLVVVTGLRLRGWQHVPLFWWFALRSMHSPQRAPGLVSVDARTIEGIHCTVSVWRSGSAMAAFARGRPHAAAVRAFSRMAVGRVARVRMVGRPDWDEALALLCEHGRAY